MGLSKTEVNLRRLLAAAPRQQNEAKLIHYIATLREQLELLGTETTAEGLTSISKAKLKDYLEKIEALAASLSTPQIQGQPIGSVDATDDSLSEDTASSKEQVDLREHPSHGLRRRHVPHTKGEDRAREITEPDQAASIKLDATAQAHIDKHRKLQEDLTDEMVELARQLKESSLVMSQSVQNTEKILDSTEKAVEHSLASTGRANTRAAEIYSETVKTSCFTWLLIFAMICVFVMVVLLIRVT